MALCSRRVVIKLSAASFRFALVLLIATNRGNTRAWACFFPSRIRRSCNKDRVLASGWSIRAISCGSTPSQVLIGTVERPDSSTVLTSGILQYRNHSFKIHSMSWVTDELYLLVPSVRALISPFTEFTTRGISKPSSFEGIRGCGMLCCLLDSTIPVVTKCCSSMAR